MAVAGAIAPFAQFAISADDLSTHNTPVVSEAMTLLAEEHPVLMARIKPLVVPLSRPASAASECVAGEHFHGGNACTECKPGFVDHDSNPSTVCKRCSQIHQKFDITAFAGTCAEMEAMQDRTDYYSQWWGTWSWAVYMFLSLTVIGVPLGYIFERESGNQKAPGHTE